MKRIKQVVKTFCEMPLPLRILIVLLFVLIVIFLFVIFCDNSRWINWLGREDKGDALDFIGIAMGGVLLAIQATVSYRRVKTMEDTAKAQADAAQAQAKAVEQQAKANQNTEQGQRQERLKNAIEHLGHGGPFVRLGGAYELFHLAEDTKELRQTVLEIFCAYICQTTRNEDYQKEYDKKPSEEIQSLLTLLFRQDHKVFDGCRINLQGSRLNGASLSRARLQKAELVDAHLQRADIWRAQLQGARFLRAQLQGAYLWEAHLQGAVLSNAHLQGANLFRAQLQGADLPDAQMQGACLWKAQLQGANLFRAQMQEADLREAQLQGVFHDYDGSQLYPSPDFAKRIRRRIDQDSYFSKVAFSGGLNEEQVNNMMKEIPDSELASQLEEILKPHIGPPTLASRKLLVDSGADTGTYTQEDADRWIKEYEEAVGRDDVHS